MYFVYILKSLKDSGYYIGSAGDPQERLLEHNNEKTKSIKHRVPFELRHTEEYGTKTDARKREIHLKKNYKARKDLFDKIHFYD